MSPRSSSRQRKRTEHEECYAHELEHRQQRLQPTSCPDAEAVDCGEDGDYGDRLDLLRTELPTKDLAHDMDGARKPYRMKRQQLAQEDRDSHADRSVTRAFGREKFL